MKTASPAERPADEGWLAEQVRGWNNFWFEPADPTLLGFIRFCTGCVLVYVYLTYSIGLTGFVGPHAWVDEKAVNSIVNEAPIGAPPTSWDETQIESRWRVTDYGSNVASVYFHVKDPAWIWTIHLAILLALVLFTIGWQTRITTVLAWLGVLGYMHRNPSLMYGMDTMTNILMLYLSIGPSGAALSVDHWLEVRRLRRAGATHIDPPAPRASARLALRLIQLHFCIIYLASGLAKLQGPTWWSGTALWNCFANIVFAPMTEGWWVGFLRFLSRHRVLWELVMGGGVVFTLVMEIGLPFAIWNRKLRWLFIIGSVFLHTGIGLTMSLTKFGLLMMCMALAFAPPEIFRAWLESWWRREQTLPPRQAPAPTVSKAPALATAR